MPNPCDHCVIRTGCDFLSGLCRLTPAEVAKLRPDLIKGHDRTKYWAEYHERNKERRLANIRATSKAYYQANKERVKARTLARYHATKAAPRSERRTVNQEC